MRIRVPSRRKIRTLSFNTLLVLVSTIFGYLIVEFVFFRIFLANVKFDIRAHLPETAEVLVQNSKADFVPRNYIALLGDSYAEGVGDWLLNNRGNEALPFSPADVLHSLTGRDVASFGRGGSSSAEGLVRQPARILAGSQCLIFPTLSEPEQILAFFYAGNDIQDNLRFLGKVRGRYGNNDTASVDKYLAEQYANLPFFQCHLYLGDTIGRMARFAYEYRNFKPSDLTPRGNGENKLIVAGKEIAAPSPLAASAMEIDDRGIYAGMMVFDRSLAWLRRRFAKSPITVVYIPSALAIYHKSGSTVIYRIEPEEANLSGTATPEAIDRRSDWICTLVRDVARKHGTGFLDARPALRAIAAEKLIHGPVDWDHLNELGYRTLAGFLASKLNDPSAVEICQY
jgi:hypothetical protein